MFIGDSVFVCKTQIYKKKKGKLKFWAFNILSLYIISIKVLQFFPDTLDSFSGYHFFFQNCSSLLSLRNFNILFDMNLQPHLHLYTILIICCSHCN